MKNLPENTQIWIECMDFSLYCQDGVLSLCQYLCFKTHYSDRKVATLLLYFPWGMTDYFRKSPNSFAPPPVGNN